MYKPKKVLAKVTTQGKKIGLGLVPSYYPVIVITIISTKYLHVKQSFNYYFHMTTFLYKYAEMYFFSLFTAFLLDISFF